MIFGCFQFGISALIVVICTVLSCVLTEYLYEIYEQTDNLPQDFILALNMPQILWIPYTCGGVFAIIVVKAAHGGLGQN